ncbi:MAG: hypothetical protein KDB00_22240 [Planctomycetales bacterium]|nr:hypothetical protein [Planctomycetales bacterium]
MRRRKREQAVNLFAFQDIITGVAGVMLFALLLLVVQLSLRLASQAADLQEQQTEQQSQQVDQQRNQIDSPVDPKDSLVSLELQLDQLRRENQDLIDALSRDSKSEIEKAQSELAELIRESEAAKSQAESLQQQIASQAVSADRKEMLAKRQKLQDQLESLKKEEQRHKSGKLVAFKTSANQARQMWVVDARDFRADLFDVQDPSSVTSVAYDRKQPSYETAAQIKTALEKQTKSKSIILVLRPSLGGTGSDLLADFRDLGFNIALELLDEETLITESADVTVESVDDEAMQ